MANILSRNILEPTHSTKFGNQRQLQPHFTKTHFRMKCSPNYLVSNLKTDKLDTKKFIFIQIRNLRRKLVKKLVALIMLPNSYLKRHFLKWALKLLLINVYKKRRGILCLEKSFFILSFHIKIQNLSQIHSVFSLHQHMEMPKMIKINELQLSSRIITT